jgi:hypothetical protein
MMCVMTKRWNICIRTTDEEAACGGCQLLIGGRPSCISATDEEATRGSCQLLIGGR